MQAVRRVAGPPDGVERSSHTTKHFYTIWVFSVAVGVVVVVMVGLVVGRNGFDWTATKDNADALFAYHPLFMSIGLIFLTGQGIILYRVFPHARKGLIKTVHALTHAATFILMVFALRAVFHSHTLQDKPNLNEVHSWMGITAVIIFSAQLLAGFLMFVLPGAAPTTRVWYLDFHAYFGSAVFTLACASACVGMGLVQVTGWSSLGSCSRVFVLAVIVYAVCIAHLISGSAYKAKSAEHVPGQTDHLTANHHPNHADYGSGY